MAGRRHGVRLPDIIAADNSNNNDGTGTGADSGTATERPQGQYLSLPSSPTNVRRPRPNFSRRPSTNEPLDERSPLLGASRPSRIRIHSAHGSPRVPLLSRNQSYAGTRAHRVHITPPSPPPPFPPLSPSLSSPRLTIPPLSPQTACEASGTTAGPTRGARG